MKTKTNNDGLEKEKYGQFWINKSGFPISEKIYERMWEYAVKQHPDGMSLRANIKGNPSLGDILFLTMPQFKNHMSNTDKLNQVQNFMYKLQYNHTGTQFFDIQKDKSVCHHLRTAKDMMRECLPIKCLEAVILGIHLTNPLTEVDRFTIGFKTKFRGTIYRHVVLGVHNSGLYGTIGLSRRENLAFKPCQFPNLAELVFDFIDNYNKLYHTVLSLSFSLPIPHDPLSYEPIHWRGSLFDVHTMDREGLRRELEKVSRKCKRISRPAGMQPQERIDLFMASGVAGSLGNGTTTSVIKRSDGSDFMRLVSGQDKKSVNVSASKKVHSTSGIALTSSPTAITPPSVIYPPGTPVNRLLPTGKSQATSPRGLQTSVNTKFPSIYFKNKSSPTQSTTTPSSLSQNKKPSYEIRV